jgi:hypothetical protein
MPIIKPGSDWDTHGCISSAGYIWCEILNKCLRTWIEACEFPSNCLTWNDGCNMCQLNNGEITLCSERYCFTRGMPSCSVYEPEVSIMPVPDYPPVINPFIGSEAGGH